jgi:hypothetical protein
MILTTNATQYLKFSRLASKQAGKKERGFRGKEFLPACLSREAGLRVVVGIREADFCQPRLWRGWQSEFSVRIFSKKGSDFVQQTQPS